MIECTELDNISSIRVIHPKKGFGEDSRKLKSKDHQICNDLVCKVGQITHFFKVSPRRNHPSTLPPAPSSTLLTSTATLSLLIIVHLMELILPEHLKKFFIEGETLQKESMDSNKLS